MGSNYENYNQAISQEKQLNEIEAEIRPQVEEQLATVESSENSYNKNLRQAVISNENVDLKSASKQKQQFQEVKQELQEPLRQIDQERQRINNQKSSVKSMDQLEAQGYKKEIRGGQIIYYKEDTYRRKKGDDKRTFREEEYIFKSDGTPVKIIERDDYRDGDRRRVDEEKIVSFDSQGRVTQVRTYDDGEKDEKINYSFNSDGSQSVSKRDYAKERKLQEKAQKEYEQKLAEERKMTHITASVDWSGNSTYTETKYNEKTGQWEKTTTKYTKERTIPTQKVSSTKTLKATKTPTIETQISQNVLNSLDFSNPESVRLAQTQTSTPEQIKAQQNVEATAITGREVVFSFSKPEKDQVNLNPTRLLIAPYQMGSAIGGYLAETVKTGGSNVVDDVSKGYETVKKQGFVKTVSNVVTGTLDHASRDPFGFVGEGVALGGAGKVTKEAVVKSTTKVKPIEINTRSVAIETSPKSSGLGVEKVEIQGSAEVTQGVIKKKTRTVEFEGEGLINKETRALGSRDPDVAVLKENALSREHSPASLYEGEIQLRAEGQTSKVKVDGISQGNKQITNVNKETFISETQSVGKLNNEDLFMTKTQNVKTGDVSVTTSKNVKSQGTTTPTQDAFASASQSQTDVFLSKKDLSPTKEKIVDAELAQNKIGETRSLENKGAQPIQAEKLSDEISITNIDELNAKRTTPKAEPTSSNQRDFANSGQSQVFEQKVSQKQSSSEVASFENNFLDDATNMFKTETRSTNIPVSSKTIKDLVTPKSNIKPAITTRSADAFSQTDLFSTDQGFSLDSAQDQGSSQKPGQDSRTKTDVETIQDPMRDSGFKQEVAQQTSQRNVQDPIVETPGVPKFNKIPDPPVRPNLDVDFNDDLSLNDPFSSKKKKGSHKGQFAGSLTALNQGIIVDDIDPNKKTSGLSKRAVLRGRGF